MLLLDGVAVAGPRGRSIIKDVRLACGPGTILGVVGPSGAGKSTVLRAVAGLAPVAAGTVSLSGSSIERVPVALRPVSFMQQSFPLYRTLTVRGNVEVAVRRPHKKNAKAETDALLRLVDLSESLWDRWPDSLSGGEAQRVALAKALGKPAGILLLDEPFSNIDKGARSTLHDTIRRHVKATGACCLFVSHDEADVLLISDGVAAMEGGTVSDVTTVPQRERPTSLLLGGLGFPTGLQVVRRHEVPADVLEKLRRDSLWRAIAWRPDASALGGERADGLVLTVEVRREAVIGPIRMVAVRSTDSMPPVEIWHLVASGQSVRLPSPGPLFLNVPLHSVYYLDERSRIMRGSGD